MACWVLFLQSQLSDVISVCEPDSRCGDLSSAVSADSAVLLPTSCTPCLSSFGLENVPNDILYVIRVLVGEWWGWWKGRALETQGNLGRIYIERDAAKLCWSPATAWLITRHSLFSSGYSSSLYANLAAKVQWVESGIQTMRRVTHWAQNNAPLRGRRRPTAIW